ncbi:MAG: anti-sigma factor [Acidimicrobiales bacterium]
MTADDSRPDIPDDDLLSDALLDDLLADPDLWAEPDPADADAIVAMIAAEAATAPVADTAAGASEPAPGVVDFAAARAERTERSERETALQSAQRRWSLGPTLLSAAAGALFAVLSWGAIQAIRTETGTELALAGTDLAPTASADVNVVVGELGTRIDLTVTGLEPAPDGFYYEAWLRKSPEVGVSAGTFHLRGGDGEVELWAGVDPADYPLLTVTLQPEAAEASSGEVVLKGTVEAD